MATKIQNFRSLTAGNQPGDLLAGELAFNLADGFMYLGSGGNNYVDTLGQVLGPSINPGGGWQQAIFNAAPINGGVTLAGIYNAQDNLVTSVTPAGSAAGFTVGALPAAAPGNEGYYVLVQLGGTLAPPAPTGDAQPGDWLVSSGTGWALVQESEVLVPASNVSIVPTGPFTGPSMQDVLNQIQLTYLTFAGGQVDDLEISNDLEVDGSTILGDADTDALTVNATSTFAAPITAQQITCANVIATSLYSSGGLRVIGTTQLDGDALIGSNTGNIVTIAGTANIGNDFSVGGNTQLNGATQVNAPLTTTGTVAFTGTGGVTLSTPLTTSGGITITIGQTADLVVNSASCMFTSGSRTTMNGDLYLNQGVTGKILNYARSANVQAPMNQFLVVPGTIVAFGGLTAPDGYVLCDGSSLSTTGQYADLFAAIGYTWGGSGATFKVPDMRGLFLRGTGSNATLKDASGRFAMGGPVGSLSRDYFSQHYHGFVNNSGQEVTQNTPYKFGLYDTQGTGQGTSLGGLSSAGYVYAAKYPRTAYANLDEPETKPVSATINYLIKY